MTLLRYLVANMDTFVAKILTSLCSLFCLFLRCALCHTPLLLLLFCMSNTVPLIPSHANRTLDRVFFLPHPSFFLLLICCCSIPGQIAVQVCHIRKLRIPSVRWSWLKVIGTSYVSRNVRYIHILPSASSLFPLQVYFSAVDGLKKLYKSKIQPVEQLYKFTTPQNSLT